MVTAVTASPKETTLASPTLVGATSNPFATMAASKASTFPAQPSNTVSDLAQYLPSDLNEP